MQPNSDWYRWWINDAGATEDLSNNHLLLRKHRWCHACLNKVLLTYLLRVECIWLQLFPPADVGTGSREADVQLMLVPLWSAVESKCHLKARTKKNHYSLRCVFDIAQSVKTQLFTLAAVSAGTELVHCCMCVCGCDASDVATWCEFTQSN